MASSAQFLFGGLLKGAGQGMVDQAEQRRQEALERARELRRQIERKEDRNFAQQRDQANREFQGGLLSRTVTGEGGEMFGITRSGQTKPLGITDPNAIGAGTGNMSPEDYRLWNMAIERNTTKGMEGEKTDWAAVEKDLRGQGREDLATLAAPDVAETKQIDVNSAEYREAQRMAEEWADSQAGFFSTDETDFAKHGGNRAGAIQAKTLEFYRQLTGGTAMADKPTETRPGTKPDQGGTPASVSGAGTRESPYTPTTQAQFEALPSGAIYKNPADGKLYRKS